MSKAKKYLDSVDQPVNEEDLKTHADSAAKNLEEVARRLPAAIKEAKKIAAGKQGDDSVIAKAIEACNWAANDESGEYFWS